MIQISLHTTFKALSDPTRRKILELLRHGSLTAGEIGSTFSISNAAISKHLALLKEAELVFPRRQGTFIHYELNTSVLEEILCWIADMKGEKK